MNYIVVAGTETRKMRKPGAMWSWHYLISLGLALTDTLDDLINDGRIEPQLAMKILSTFDRVVTEVLADRVRARLTFKVHCCFPAFLRHNGPCWPDDIRTLTICFSSSLLGPPRYVPILRWSLDLPHQGRDFQAGQPDFGNRGQGEDRQLQQQATGRGIDENI